MAGPKPAALPLGYAPTISSLHNIAATPGVVSSTLTDLFRQISQIPLENSNIAASIKHTEGSKGLGTTRGSMDFGGMQ